MVDEPVVHRRFAAPQEASDLVAHLWVVRQGDGVRTREVLLPDGRALVVVATGEPGVLVDPLTGTASADASGVRGLTTRAVVREQTGAAVRLGARLNPLALARLVPGTHAVDRVEPLGVLLAQEQVAAVRAALDAGQDAAAARLLGAAVAAVRRPATEDPSIALLAPVIQTVELERGLVTSGELARRADLAIGTLHRWFAAHTGVEPPAYLAAVRFSAFVREAIGPGPARPQDVLATIRWYARAGYPPREVERFTGLAPLELRRLEHGLADVLGVPA